MTDPRFSNKETRKLAAELRDNGFTYQDDDSKGHARYVHPSGRAVKLSETPGNGQIKRVRNEMARIVGSARGGYDPTAARERASTERASARAAASRAEAERAAIIRAHDQRSYIAAVEAKVSARRRELYSIQSLMGARGSSF